MENQSLFQVSNFIWFFDELGYSGKHFVVELNGEILSKEAYTTTKLTAADRLEIVSFVGGN